MSDSRQYLLFRYKAHKIHIVSETKVSCSNRLIKMSSIKCCPSVFIWGGGASAYENFCENFYSNGNCFPFFLSFINQNSTPERIYSTYIVFSFFYNWCIIVNFRSTTYKLIKILNKIVFVWSYAWSDLIRCNILLYTLKQCANLHIKADIVLYWRYRNFCLYV